jgi:hypothetical protein
MATVETPAPLKAKTIKVEYPNLRSRLLLNGFFQRQFIIPEDPPWLLERFMMFYERWLMKIDLTGISEETNHCSVCLGRERPCCRTSAARIHKSPTSPTRCTSFPGPSAWKRCGRC